MINELADQVAHSPEIREEPPPLIHRTEERIDHPMTEEKRFGRELIDRMAGRHGSLCPSLFQHYKQEAQDKFKHDHSGYWPFRR
jgi:hypothetical protein